MPEDDAGDQSDEAVLTAFAHRLRHARPRPDSDPAAATDLERAIAAVRTDPYLAGGYVRAACRRAHAAPGLLAPAALVARAVQEVTGDGSLIGLVAGCRERLNESGTPEGPLRRRRGRAPT